jgi:hypothetical protein
MIFKLRIKSFIDLNDPPSHTPSFGSPSVPTPVHQPILSSFMQNPHPQAGNNSFHQQRQTLFAITGFFQLMRSMFPLTKYCILRTSCVSPHGFPRPNILCLLCRLLWVRIMASRTIYCSQGAGRTLNSSIRLLLFQFSKAIPFRPLQDSSNCLLQI